ncbi:MAG: Gfo/Idh/MocA family oxidoreductase [Nocardioidaceae bacterium]|nr:Gfo/Idh/MocA family oxidoreductase [Nocardioidaceae bacterium]NUS52564.1 Gfo/Idh/MocA family oxidoreductase [Nocardioidaceae bacterium]
MPSLPNDLPPLDVTPGPRRAEPLPADRPVRWGIVSTGKIATAFVKDLALLDDCEVAAVGARRQESADAFAAEHGIARAYGDYRALVADPDVDVVYVGTPHSLHREHVELAFDAGKPVLCEKALTLTAADAQALVDRARAENLFLMEAMWMRCQPLVRRLRQLVHAGALGAVRQVRADLGFVVDRPPTDRLLDPALGGGALLDMGIYPLTFASLFLGEPATVSATASLSESGVDLNLAVGLGYESGAVAALTASMTSWSPRSASIATDVGRIDLPAPFHHPTTVTWTPLVGDPDFDVPPAPRELKDEAPLGVGYTHEAREVVRCLRNGETESPLVPLDDTVALMRQMDRIRELVGVRYPADATAHDRAPAG